MRQYQLLSYELYTVRLEDIDTLGTFEVPYYVLDQYKHLLV